MFNKLLTLCLACFLTLNFCGCALTSNSIVESPKEPKLICNVSYVQAMVMVQGALKSEPIQFEKATISKDTARLKGNYPDGRTVQIVFFNISKSESNLVVLAGASLAEKEEARKIIATIMQYTHPNK
jgi:hypothetical protein